MNREMLFKAKRKDNGKWVEGYYCKLDETTYCISEDYERHPVPTHHYILYETMTDWGLPNRFLQFEIDPDTLCQYTGLTDKNGKRIWENDILRGHKNDDDLARVVFGEFSVIDVDTLETVDRVVGWHTEVIETDALSKCEPFCLPMPLADFYIKRSEFEVFGNIFDNPELLEVK